MQDEQQVEEVLPTKRQVINEYMSFTLTSLTTKVPALFLSRFKIVKLALFTKRERVLICEIECEM